MGIYLEPKLAGVGVNESIKPVSQRRHCMIVDLIRACFLSYGHVDIIDIGGQHSDWQKISGNALEKYKVNITLVNTTVDSADPQSSRFDSVSIDKNNFGRFAPDSFQLIVCDSLREYAETVEAMEHLCMQIRKLAPSYYVQLPETLGLKGFTRSGKRVNSDLFKTWFEDVNLYRQRFMFMPKSLIAYKFCEALG